MIQKFHTQNRFYYTITILICLFIFSFSIVNAIYFNKLKNTLPHNLALHEANMMVIVNVICVISSISLLLYTSYRLSVQGENRQSVYTNFRDAVSQGILHKTNHPHNTKSSTVQHNHSY